MNKLEQIDTMTRAIQELIANDEVIAKWSVIALSRINRDGGTPDMVVGRPGEKEERLEDDGRTLILPLPVGKEKVYACINETNGVTLMLAEEY